MKFTIELLRQRSSSEKPFWQTIEYDADEELTVASLLKKLNADLPADKNGKKIEPIHWECSCLQKKCGACAMVINGRPRLACDTKLSELKKRKLTLEPLRKFPTVRDLVVDRGVMMENLKNLAVWLEENSDLKQKKAELAYEASRCLQCGCCLDVCPNFLPEGGFFSAAAIVPVSRVIAELSPKKKYDVLSRYQKNIYNGCGKSLSCMNVCPAEIDIQNLLVNSNAAAIWKLT